VEYLKILHDCNLQKGDKKHLQAGKNKSSVSDDKIAEECAGCGEKNPEYVLEDRHLCFYCYKAEKHYWAKGVI